MSADRRKVIETLARGIPRHSFISDGQTWEECNPAQQARRLALATIQWTALTEDCGPVVPVADVAALLRSFPDGYGWTEWAAEKVEREFSTPQPTTSTETK